MLPPLLMNALLWTLTNYTTYRILYIKYFTSLASANFSERAKSNVFRTRSITSGPDWVPSGSRVRSQDSTTHLPPRGCVLTIVNHTYFWILGQIQLMPLSRSKVQHRYEIWLFPQTLKQLRPLSSFSSSQWTSYTQPPYLRICLQIWAHL